MVIFFMRCHKNHKKNPLFMSISTLIVESTFSPNPCLNLQVLTPFHILARKSTLRSLFVKVLKGGQAPFFT